MFFPHGKQKTQIPPHHQLIVLVNSDEIPLQRMPKKDIGILL